MQCPWDAGKKIMKFFVLNVCNILKDYKFVTEVRVLRINQCIISVKTTQLVRREFGLTIFLLCLDLSHGDDEAKKNLFFPSAENFQSQENPDIDYCLQELRNEVLSSKLNSVNYDNSVNLLASSTITYDAAGSVPTYTNHSNAICHDTDYSAISTDGPANTHVDFTTNKNSDHDAESTSTNSTEQTLSMFSSVNGPTTIDTTCTSKLKVTDVVPNLNSFISPPSFINLLNDNSNLYPSSSFVKMINSESSDLVDSCVRNLDKEINVCMDENHTPDTEQEQDHCLRQDAQVNF